MSLTAALLLGMTGGMCLGYGDAGGPGTGVFSCLVGIGNGTGTGIPVGTATGTGTGPGICTRPKPVPVAVYPPAILVPITKMSRLSASVSHHLDGAAEGGAPTSAAQIVSSLFLFINK
jgi:hypothetical protein